MKKRRKRRLGPWAGEKLHEADSSGRGERRCFKICAAGEKND
jgi:hypothetical protein